MRVKAPGHVSPRIAPTGFRPIDYRDFHMPKLIISVDLAAAVGSWKLHLGADLPRREKKVLEQMMAEKLIRGLERQNPKDTFTSLRSNPDDPPDILLEYNGETTGIEVTELLPPNRLENDSIIRSIRESILTRLVIGEQTKNRVMHISLRQDSNSLRPGKCAPLIAQSLNDAMTDAQLDQFRVPIPTELSESVVSIDVDTIDLTGDPRLANPDHPLIIFSSQHTVIRPEIDVPAMLEKTVGNKINHALSTPSWLLIWTKHHATATVCDELFAALPQYLGVHTCRIQYRRVYYLDLSPPAKLGTFLPT